MAPETYIVRVYRRSRGPSIVLAGRIETPGGSLCASFTSLAELGTILLEPHGHLREAEVPPIADLPGSSAMRLRRKKKTR